MEKKITLSEYADRVSPIPLLDWQRKILKAIEEADTEKMELIFNPGRCPGRKMVLDILDQWEEYTKMYSENEAIEQMLTEAGKVVGTAADEREVNIAKAVAERVCKGLVNATEIANCSRERRKRIVAIAFNMVGAKPFICRVIGTKNGKCCEECSRVCCHNKVLQRRFAAEMFPGFKVY